MALAKYGMIILAQKAITVVGINCITATGCDSPYGKIQLVPFPHTVR